MFFLCFCLFLIESNTCFAGDLSDEDSEDLDKFRATLQKAQESPESIIESWITSLKEGKKRVELFSFDSEISKILTTDDQEDLLFQRVYAQLVTELKKGKQADGGYLVRYYARSRKVSFNAFGGSLAR